MSYIRAIATGNFSSTSTWNGGVVPGAGDVACADTFRITLDVDPLADLSVAAADLVAAGGTAGTSKTGGFTVPGGATRTIASVRYDHSMTATRNAASTSPLVVTHGTVTLGTIEHINGSGYTATTTALWVVNAL